MTSKENVRIRELPNLIADESNPKKMISLAAELERLLACECRERKEKSSVGRFAEV